MKVTVFSLLVIALSALQASAQVKNKAFGWATGTTGGGNAKPQTPTSPAQLKQWLEDDVARVILLDRTYDFRGTEGICKDCAGCIPTSYTCGSKGQLAIALPNLNWCDSLPKTKVTYDKAGITAIQVKSNKSIVGVGNKGVILGKGLRLAAVQNVIIQNIHISQINPSLIWGGDGIALEQTNKVWIDHCKTSLIGRMHLATGYTTAGDVTISNTEFDGRTSWSASCDGRHYFNILGYGKGDRVTFAGNYIHHTSGRAPKLEYNSAWHVVNNYWLDNSGHAFDVGAGNQAIIEGNHFENIKTISLPDPNPGQVFAPTTATANKCKAYFNRDCQPNLFSNSPAIVGSDSGILGKYKGYSAPPANPASGLKQMVLNYAGTGKI